MPTLDQIQARLRAEVDRAIRSRMESIRTGSGQDTDAMATFMDDIEARLMQPAAHAEEPETPSTPTQPRQDKQDKEAMPHLTDEIKTFIVKGLACGDTPSQVAEAVRVEFNIVVTRQQVHEYDPACVRPPAQRWRDLYAATRQAFLRETAEIGISHRAVRLRMLDRIAHSCERNSVALALRCLEMAAKECGGLYERRKPVVSQPAAQPAATQPETPQHAATPAATPQPAATRPKPSKPKPSAPRPAAPSPVLKQPSMPERTAPQVPVPQAAVPQAAAPQPPQPTPPQPTPPQPDNLRADIAAPVAPQPPAVPEQAPQTPALSEGRPLNREERYHAYVRDRHARDRSVAAQARLDSGR